MGYERKDIDLTDQQLSLLEIGTILSPLPHQSTHTGMFFSDQLQEELRDITRKTSAMFYYSEKVTRLYLWDPCGAGAMTSVTALRAKTKECASRQSKSRKRCGEREGDGVTIYKPFK